jgi:hypothetical protein
VVPSDSYLVKYYDLLELHYGTMGAPLYVVVREGADYSSHEVQDELVRLTNEIKSNYWSYGPVLSWYNDLMFWAATRYNSTQLPNGRIPQAKFMSYLMEFLLQSDIGSFHRGNLVIRDNEIVVSRLMGYSRGLFETDDYVNAITSIRDVVEDSILDAYAYSIFYVYFEQYLFLNTEAVRIILLAIGVMMRSMHSNYYF